ncbi:RpoE-regulated lipoprotein [Trabulsiella odontotermitis]|uniref:RpoE-regulated lipoprotein n=1 Tax=Trabulsiella odontotermitis TaxID=379893 RepID=UPI0006BA5DF4|nr:RpoE-regulated lipoprotein [Trabulsiella odontotermitis]
MKSLRLLLCVFPLALTGCSTLGSVNWSAAYPWNWFGSSMAVTGEGVGELTAVTPLDEKAVSEALGGDYRVRSGMKTANGGIVRYFEALKDDKVALVINGDSGTVSRIDVLDRDIASAEGVKVGTPFSDVFDKAYGNCQKATGDDSTSVECKAKSSPHISYLFSGNWSGPENLMPSDDTLKNWQVSKIIWRR